MSFPLGSVCTMYAKEWSELGAGAYPDSTQWVLGFITSFPSSFHQSQVGAQAPAYPRKTFGGQRGNKCTKLQKKGAMELQGITYFYYSDSSAHLILSSY